VDSTKKLGRRHFLTIAGATSALAVTTGAAKAAGKAAAAGCNEGAGQTIKGVVVEKPVHTPVIMRSMREMMAKGEAVAGAPVGGFSSPPKATPGVYVGDGKYLLASSKADVVSEGKVGDTLASGVKISAQRAGVGGVYIKGIGSEYILADAKIDLSGDAGMGLGGANSGAAADDYATLILRNCTITTSGKNRNATSVQNHGVLKVYNCTLTANGVPFTPDTTSTDQKKQLEIDGNSRAHVTLSNSYSYFYYSTIISEGWAALSTDAADGFVYLEANDCTVRTLKSGYGTYADGMCHNVINRSDFDVASMAAIIADEADVTFNDTKAKCGSYFALVHAIAGQSNVAATLKVKGGEIATKKAAVLVKSANSNISFDGSKIVSEKGVLIESCVSVDPGAAKLAHPAKSEKVYGIHATFKNMDVAGDIVHTADKENRDMTVYLESTTLRGVIKDAYLSMNRLSKWIATADSNVIIIGDVDVSQIDAPAGVTITAVASVSGKCKLASCGTLILQAS
jgi:hypothetical protein